MSVMLGALVSREQDRLQCAPKDTVTYSRFTQFDDRQWALYHQPVLLWLSRC